MTPTMKDSPDHRCRGAAMLLVLIAVAVVTVLALSFLASQQPTAVVASNIDHKAKARHIAESALKMAIDYVNEDANWRTDKTSGVWLSGVALDGGSFTLTGTDEDDGDLSDDASEAVTLSVVATYDGVTHRVSAVVTPHAVDLSDQLLFVAGRGSSPSAIDQGKIDLFESWGYTVTVIDDGDAQSVYDAAAAVNDVAYVSEEVVSSRVGTKLRDATIGVVNDEPYLHDEFGFTTSNTGNYTVQTQLDVVDNTHPITAGLSLGTLTIYSSSMRIQNVTSTIASGVTVLTDEAGSGTRANLMAAEAGDALHHGPAAGRRVIVPAGDDFDVDQLSPDGLTLMRQALAWAAGADSDGGTEPTLLALYEFEQVTVEPTLAGRWPLDELPGGGGAGVVLLNDKLSIYSGGMIDAYDPTAGVYGGANLHQSAAVTTNSTGSDDVTVNNATIYGDVLIGSGGSTSNVIQFYSGGSITGSVSAQAANTSITDHDAPSGFGSHTGNQTYNGGTHTWSSNQHFDDLTLNNNAQVYVSGDVQVRVSDRFTVNDGDIILNAGATLTLWVEDHVNIYSGSTINDDSTRPGDLTIIQYGSLKDMAINGAVVSGAIYVSDDLTLSSGAQVYGSVVCGDDLTINNSEIHVANSGIASLSAGEEVDFGNTSSSGSSYDTAENDQAATQFTLAQAMTVTSMSAYLWGADDGGDVRFAIYEDSSGSPGALIAESGKESLREESWGWETESIGPVDLSPGTYWLALSIEGDDGTARYRYQSGGTTRHNANNGVDNGFNDPWGSSSATLSHTIAIYASGTTSGSSAAPETTADTSDLGNDGTTYGEPVAGVSGQHGTAFSFDGSDDYIEIPHDDSYLMQAGTFSVWFKADSTSGRQGLFSKDSSGYDTGGHFSVFLDGNRVEVRMQSTTQSHYVYSPSSSINTGQWYHIMFAWGEEGMALYLDGVEVDTDPYTGGTGTTSGGTGNYEAIVLGANAWRTGDLTTSGLEDYFDGTLDDLRIYNERLSAAQALEIYNGAVEPSPFLSEAIIEDTSGYGDPLTLSVNDTDAVTWPGSGLAFDGDAVATSLEPASKLYDAISATGEFSVELLLTRASPGSTASPSRIAELSEGSSDANFVLGQDGAGYEARVRDASTGNDGSLSPEFISTTELNGLGDTHIVLSYKAGEVTVFIDGALDETHTAGAGLSNWEDDMYLLLGGTYGGGSYWDGTLKRVAIYDRGFNQVQADNVYNGEAPGDGASAAAGAGLFLWDELD